MPKPATDPVNRAPKPKPRATGRVSKPLPKGVVFTGGTPPRRTHKPLPKPPPGVFGSRG